MNIKAIIVCAFCFFLLACGTEGDPVSPEQEEARLQYRTLCTFEAEARMDQCPGTMVFGGSPGIGGRCTDDDVICSDELVLGLAYHRACSGSDRFVDVAWSREICRPLLSEYWTCMEEASDTVCNWELACNEESIRLLDCHQGATLMMEGI